MVWPNCLEAEIQPWHDTNQTVWAAVHAARDEYHLGVQVAQVSHRALTPLQEIHHQGASAGSLRDAVVFQLPGMETPCQWVIKHPYASQCSTNAQLSSQWGPYFSEVGEESKAAAAAHAQPGSLPDLVTTRQDGGLILPPLCSSCWPAVLHNSACIEGIYACKTSTLVKAEKRMPHILDPRTSRLEEQVKRAKDRCL